MKKVGFKLKLQQSSVYQVFVRSYGHEPLKALANDLDRIKAMGFNYLYMMPIHPISKINRKGSLGSPYSISDYYAIEESLGNLEDFKAVVDRAHQLGLGVIMDMVFNHTGGDHYYLKEHPEYYNRDEAGNLVHRIGDWSDIVDLDLSNQDLQEELIKVLKYWADLKVDGFRFDVASLLPMSFWRKARKALDQVNPNLLWAAESIDLNFHQAIMKAGIEVENIPALAEVFDIFYDYETWDILQKAFTSEKYLKLYSLLANRQFLMQPNNTILWRFVENHDQDRIASITDELETWLIFNLLSYGMGFVYQGQEWAQSQRTSLFELDLLEPRAAQFSPLIQRLNAIKRKIYQDKVLGYQLSVDQGLFKMEITTEKASYFVLLNPFAVDTYLTLEMSEGIDLLSQQLLKIHDQQVHSHQFPLVLEKLA